MFLAPFLFYGLVDSFNIEWVAIVAALSSAGVYFVWYFTAYCPACGCQYMWKTIDVFIIPRIVVAPKKCPSCNHSFE